MYSLRKKSPCIMLYFNKFYFWNHVVDTELRLTSKNTCIGSDNAVETHFEFI